MENRRWSEGLNHIQYMAKVPKVSLYDLYFVCDTLQPLGGRHNIESDEIFLPFLQ
jgi:hypothetical protein